MELFFQQQLALYEQFKNHQINPANGILASTLPSPDPLKKDVQPPHYSTVEQGETEKLRAQLTALQTQLDTANKSHQDEVGKLKDQIQTLNGTVDKNKREYENTIATMKSSNTELQLKLNAKVDELNANTIALNQVKGDADKKDIAFVKIIAGLTQAESKKNEHCTTFAALSQQVAQRQAQFSAFKTAADAEKQRILSGLGKSQGPGTLTPGHSTDAIWESILQRHWDGHMKRFGGDWHGPRTTNADRAGVVNSIRGEYIQVVNQQIQAQAAAKNQSDLEHLRRIQSEIDTAKKALASAQNAEAQAKADYAAQMQRALSAY